MITKQEIKNIAEIESNRGGFDFRDISVEEYNPQRNEPHFQMRTSLENKKTEIKYDPFYEEKNSGKTPIVVRDGIRHEINHHKYKGYSGCPRNLDNHVNLIYEPIMDVLAEKGFSPEDAHYMSNALEDTILHDDLSNGFSLQGINEFFKDVGETSGKYTAFYEAHARLNNALWANKTQKQQLKKYFTSDEKQRKKILEALSGFLEESGINEFKQELNEAKIRDKSKIRSYLLNEKNWQKISQAYAKNMSELMEPNYAQCLMNHNGSGTKGKKTEESSSEGNEFDREMKTKDFKRTRIQKAYNSGEEIPNWINSFEGLDLIYESLAKKLNIKAESFTKQSSMPIFWYGSREFDPETDDLKHISLGVNDSGELDIKKKRWNLNMPLEVKISQRGFPRARFGLIDCSGSMAWNPAGGRDAGSKTMIPWGNNSRYHYALLSWYGFLEYLRQNHLLNQNAVDLAGFSEETVIGKGLLESKKVALSPQFGDTSLDLNKVKSFFEGRGNLIFSISDGEVDNWRSIKKNYLDNAGKHYYFHLQIGNQTEMFKDLKKAGFYAEQVLGNNDLANKTIDLTDKILRGGIK
ncbi:MAG: hypothetical protein WC438_04760 [Candidatus Pacearchaeota archaeon]